MKKTVILLVTLFLIGGVNAAYSKGLKIAVVDLQKALNETNEGKQAKKIIEESVKQKQDIIKKKEAELKKKKEALDKLSPNSSEYNKKLNDYQKSINKLRSLIEKSQNELSQKESIYSKNILNSLINIIKKIRKKEGYDLVIEIHAGVVDYNPAIDITNQVVKRYNKLTSPKK